VVREIEEKLPGGMRPTLAAINDVRFIYFLSYLLDLVYQRLGG
jgi:hypothetical protein